MENSRVAHAYIFLGPKGVGKTLTAVNFAKALNCLASVDNEACDACISCRKINNSNHPDIFFVKPEKEGASIKIDSIRGLIKDINLKPYEGRKKVYVIDGADLMTQEASNALLKTLEAPPSDSVVILISENLNLLFRTIISRSQVVRFFPLGAEEVKNILAREYAVEDAQARVLAHLSSGKLGEAIKYKDEDVFKKRSKIITAMLNRALFDMDLEKSAREDLRTYLDIMLTWYRDILAAKSGAGQDSLINLDKKDDILREASNLDIDYLDKVINQIMLTSSYLDQNANAKLVMSVLAAKIQESR
jgi:DNA polymerase-3 subunit delta'